MTENKNTFVNVDFSKDLELLEALDEMKRDDDLDRSKLIRKLIRQEYNRRQLIPLPTTTKNSRNKATIRATSLAA